METAVAPALLPGEVKKALPVQGNLFPTPAELDAQALGIEVSPEEEQQEPVGSDLRKITTRFMKKNPEIYQMYEKYALEMAATGRRFGIGLVAERVRWECFFVKVEGEKFKVNNSHRAYIARQLVQDHPELAKVMKFRKTKY